MIGLRPGILRKLRADMTQAELAEKAGVSRATINRLEQGHAEAASFETINKLARALGQGAEVFVTFEK